MRRVCVMGLGHIGLPMAAMLAGAGFRVLGCDTDPAVLDAVSAGRAHFPEAGLDALLATAVSAGRLRARPAPEVAECFIIAVPTPLGPAHGADLTSVNAALDAIAPLLRPDDLVILESTCPVGTTEALAARAAALRPDLARQLHWAHAPERVLPGAMLREIAANDRIIGGLTPEAGARARAIYESFVTGQCWVTDSRTAEFAKLAENAFRDVNIAFANELASVAEGLGVDAFAAIALANRHPRVDILRPGPGVGGHCIAVDPWFLAQAAPAATPLIRAARAVNDARPAQVVARIRALARLFRAPVVACLGVTYKADVADLRGSPALAIAEALSRDAGLEVLVCDPFHPGMKVEEALARADIVAILVPHTAFRALDRALFRDRLVVDTVGLLR